MASPQNQRCRQAGTGHGTPQEPLLHRAANRRRHDLLDGDAGRTRGQVCALQCHEPGRPCGRYAVLDDREDDNRRNERRQYDSGHSSIIAERTDRSAWVLLSQHQTDSGVNVCPALPGRRQAHEYP